MNRPAFNVHAVSVAGHPVYTCRECGRSAEGDWTRVEFGGAMPTNEEIGRAARTPHHMPVGWASYGRGEYACPEHKR